MTATEWSMWLGKFTEGKQIILNDMLDDFVKLGVSPEKARYYIREMMEK